jgi:hypothetical protein
MTLKDDEIMSVALMVAEKQILAMSGVNILPILESQFYGRKRRVVMSMKLNAVVL